jgi:hypothetical protein
VIAQQKQADLQGINILYLAHAERPLCKRLPPFYPPLGLSACLFMTFYLSGVCLKQHSLTKSLDI